MLKAPPRKASAIPSPMMMSGTARTSVADVIAYQEPKAPFQSAPSAAVASYPPSCRPAARTATPSAIAAAATATPGRRTRVLPRGGQHEGADLRPRRAGRRLEQRPADHDDDPAGEREDFVEVAGVDQHRGSSF